MNRHLALAVVLMSIPGCTNGNTPAPTDSVLGIVMNPVDFVVGLDNTALPDPPGTYPPGPIHDVIGVGWVGTLSDATADELDVYLCEHAFLVSVSSERRVPGAFEPGWTMLSGAPATDDPRAGRGCSFHAVGGPLPDGWYVLGLDLADWMSSHPSPPPTVGGHRVGGTTYVRFHVGPTTSWVRSYLHCGDFDGGTGCAIAPSLTGPQPDGPNHFALTVGGVPDPACIEHRDPETVWYWLCPSFPDGTEFELRLVDRTGIDTPDGVETHRLTLTTGSETEHEVAPEFGIEIARRAP